MLSMHARRIEVKRFHEEEMRSRGLAMDSLRIRHKLVRVKRLARLAVIAALVLGTTGATAHANDVETVPMTSSPNPSVYGEWVTFTIDVGNWCQAGGSVLELWDGPNYLSLVYLPNTFLGRTTSIWRSNTLSVGTHRLWGQTGSHVCFYQPNIIVSLVISDYLQVVNPPPQPQAPAPPPPPPPTSPPTPTPALSLVVLPSLHLGATAPPAQTSPPPAASVTLKPAAWKVEPPVSSGTSAVVAAGLAALAIVGGWWFRQRRLRRSRPDAGGP
jgi:hypothetical protein